MIERLTILMQEHALLINLGAGLLAFWLVMRRTRSGRPRRPMRLQRPGDHRLTRVSRARAHASFGDDDSDEDLPPPVNYRRIRVQVVVCLVAAVALLVLGVLERSG